MNLKEFEYINCELKYSNAKSKATDIKIVDKIIFKALIILSFLNIKYFLPINKNTQIITPTQADIDVAIGIIIKPILLKKNKLIKTFINTTPKET